MNYFSVRILPVFILVALLLACQPTKDEPIPIKAGIWQAELSLKEGINLPFRFELQNDQWTIHNGEERLVVEDVIRKGDSLFVTMPVFNSEFHLVIASAERLSGLWYNFSRGADYSVPFEANFGSVPRFKPGAAPAFALAERYEVVFSEGIPGEEYPAIGLFETQGERVLGTFLTETGDYRYLEGIVDGNRLKLSCFDGDHAFLFEATLGKNDSLKGTFWSGNHWEEPWWAAPNAAAELRQPEELTYLKEGYESLSFSFPNLQGDSVRFPNPAYEGKVVILQIMGSWCPNCLDETKLYTKWYDRYHDQGLEIIGLAFERSQGKMDLAQKMVQRLKDKLEIDYELLITATDNDKAAAAEKLPMLNHILSYPTSIFIDRKGRVRKIHTGFNGPGTGVYYSRYVEEYEAFLEKMLAETNED